MLGQILPAGLLNRYATLIRKSYAKKAHIRKLWMISITEYIDDKSLKPSQREHDLWRVDADGTESAQYPSTIGKITYCAYQ